MSLDVIKLMRDKFCIESVASFKEINSSSTNKSVTKQTYSFSKHPRFDPVRPVCNKSTYGGDFIQHKANGAGIGYGIRSDFTKTLAYGPGSTQYNMVSDFENNKIKLRGSSVGLSRDAVLFNQYIPKESFKIPGSTHYEHEKFQKFRSPSFSLRSKTKMLDRSMTIDPERQNPGPGSYMEPRTAKVSRFAQISYGTSKSDRFMSSANGVPGVGQYINIENISGVGKYNNSKHLGGTIAKFSRSSRSTFVDEIIKSDKSKPGPGFYKNSSQFGQYDGDVYNYGQSTSKNNKNA